MLWKKLLFVGALGAAAQDPVNQCRVVTSSFVLTASANHYDAFTPSAIAAATAGTTTSYTKTPDHYCNSNHVYAYTANVSVAACEAQCGALDCTCFDYSAQPQPPPLPPTPAPPPPPPPTPITNAPLFIDMVQNNPGDAVGWEQTKYFDAEVLAGLSYTGQTTTGEMAGTQAIAFASLGLDLFPAGSAARRWLDAYRAGVHAFVDRAVAAGLAPYFFVDLLVFPVALLRAWPNATADGSGAGRIAWNDATRQLVRVLIAETFAEFPAVAGWIVRTGETYTYDNPYHCWRG